MNHQPIRKPYVAKHSPAASNWASIGHRWERRVHYLLWLLASACLVLAGLVWWRILSSTL